MKKRILNLALLLLCIPTLLVSALYSQLLDPDTKRSIIENRPLVQFKDPTWETVWDGSWFSFFESYSKDQFNGRDTVIQLHYGILDLLGVRERNGYVLGKDYFVMPVKDFVQVSITQERAQAYAQPRVSAMREIAQTADTYGGTVIYLNAPHKTELFPEKYPELYYSFENTISMVRDTLIKMSEDAGIAVVETYDLLDSRKNEYIYYATDHHWTIRGAYYAYQELLTCINKLEENQELIYPAYEELNITVNHDTMYGSYLRKLGFSGLIKVDYMEYALPYDMPEFIRYDDGEISQLALCNTEMAQYEGYMGGNIGNTVIETNREELPSILYIGFSYTNPLEAMSVYNFDRIESIDPRHWDGVLCQYVMESQPDYIVIVRDDLYEGNPELSCTVE